jgi:RelA/SpoT family (p)ppGpp synthetase
MTEIATSPTVAQETREPPRFLISDLCSTLEDYLDAPQVREVYDAYLFGAEAHDGQQRLSGEPYIYHPVAVARILADMHMDHKTIVAAILHDVIEDTPTVKEQLAERFGDDVADLVDGVSKLSAVDVKSAAEAQAENFRKMMLAMARDIRVIIIKLADRLHNMRTLGFMRLEKRRRIARETLEIYVPIAHRLGMNRVRLDLEELGFASCYPMRHRVLADAVRKARGNRKEIVSNIQGAIERRLYQEQLTGRVLGREKHLYSIYRKMRRKHLSFSEVYDVYAFRILVDNVDTCYRSLGAIHNLYKPVPGRFKDYVAIPKANGYQSLHTTLFGPHGVPIEVQIRTEEMHQLAESGIAADWLYKSEGESSAHARATEWLRGVLEMQKGAGDSVEFLEHVKIDLFPDEAYVFTPVGEIMKLRAGATVVDFAYAVHTGVGNTCVAARIDRRLAPLRTRLQSGQTVEVITAPGAHPNPAWLNFVTTGKARANIRAYLKQYRHGEAVELGRRLLNKELGRFGESLNTLPDGCMSGLLEGLKLASQANLLEDVGLGNRSALLMARRLLQKSEDAPLGKHVAVGEPAAPLTIKGTEGIVVQLARCCRPIPGDPIVGHFSAGRGLVVHQQVCANIAESRRRSEDWVDVQWDDDASGEFTSEIRVDVANERGVLATVASAIAQIGSNIENVSMNERDGMASTLTFVLTVFDRLHLARVIRRLRAIPVVMRISRVRG